MKRVVVAAGKAVSLKEQGRLIAKLLQERGLAATLETKFMPQWIYSKHFYGVIFVYPADPVYCLEYASYYTLVKPRLGERCVFYTTIEGYPIRSMTSHPIWRNVSFVANSKFTATILKKCGWKVEWIVPHAVDLDEVKRALELAEKLRRKLEADFPDKVIFGVVCADNIRKNLDGLVLGVKSAKAMLNYRDLKDFVVLLITERRRANLWEDEVVKKTCYFVAEFGTRSHEEILAFMAACDYTIFPSVCEGFGLPVLESMAVGTPVLHCWFPPLSEFSDQDANVTWDYDEEEVVEPRGGGQRAPSGGLLFLLHKYHYKKLGDAIIKAIEIKTKYPSQYEEMKQRCVEIARQYDYRKVYAYFAERLGA